MGRLTHPACAFPGERTRDGQALRVGLGNPGRHRQTAWVGDADNLPRLAPVRSLMKSAAAWKADTLILRRFWLIRFEARPDAPGASNQVAAGWRSALTGVATSAHRAAMRRKIVSSWSSVQPVDLMVNAHRLLMWRAGSSVTASMYQPHAGYCGSTGHHRLLPPLGL